MAALQRSSFFLGVCFLVLGLVGFATVGQARLTCVQYVRALTDFEIRGDGWMWWHRAEGVYPRGKSPRVGAVMVFGRQGNLPYGHVSVVSDIIDDRTILVNHSWVRRLGLRCGAMVVDTSAANDWSRVRVWHGPTNQLGLSQYRILGFVYPIGSRQNAVVSLDGNGSDRPLAKKLPPHYVWCKPMVIPGQKPGALQASADGAALPADSLVQAVLVAHKPTTERPIVLAARTRVPVHIQADVSGLTEASSAPVADTSAAERTGSEFAAVETATAPGGDPSLPIRPGDKPDHTVRAASLSVVQAAKADAAASELAESPVQDAGESTPEAIVLAAVPAAKPDVSGSKVMPSRKPAS